MKRSADVAQLVKHLPNMQTALGSTLVLSHSPNLARTLRRWEFKANLSYIADVCNVSIGKMPMGVCRTSIAFEELVKAGMSVAVGMSGEKGCSAGPIWAPLQSHDQCLALWLSSTHGLL